MTKPADLSQLNTLKVSARAHNLIAVTSSDELVAALGDIPAHAPIQILGGGSNVILHDTLPGTTILIAIKERTVLSQSGDSAVVRAGAGENWHEWVLWCHHNAFHGLANLSLIPGSVGAAPIQNIGAYGVEVGQFIHTVHVIHRRTGEREMLSPEDCDFRYRDSVFKHERGGEWIITAVDFALSAEAPVQANYPTLRARLRDAELTHDAVLASVMSIRRERLPDPVITPNVGSFFKNPIVSLDVADGLRQGHPEIPVFPADGGQVKISAAWLIDQLGWRGEERSGVRVSADHALVLEGCGAKSATPWLTMAEAIHDSVLEAYGVSLEIEPRIIGSPAGSA